MKQQYSPESEAYLQVQIPIETKHALELKAAEERISQRMLVLKALAAIGIQVPEKSICDRRKPAV